MNPTLPVPIVACALLPLAVTGQPTLITEGSALVVALGIIAYLVRQEQLHRRQAKSLSGNPGAERLVALFADVLAKHTASHPCVEHGQEIVGLKRDIGYLTRKVESLCNSKRSGGT